MGTLTVRNLDDGVQQLIRERAAENGRSMEAEARAILSAAVLDAKNPILSWLRSASELRGADLPLPARSTARTIDLA